MPPSLLGCKGRRQRGTGGKAKTAEENCSERLGRALAWSDKGMAEFPLHAPI